jgi:hypothetical protein
VTGRVVEVKVMDQNAALLDWHHMTCAKRHL